ncbi:hypothetical protein I203_102603 [Kwoniella mangroviensis CBS 8507]|uniref:uncharacterized protein n=1 Tax=Kwoniella mangroviensis CBS 8507 TaxID=1296122 RepID=UPI00304D33CE
MQIGHPPSRSSRALASLTSNAGAYADQTKRYVGERVSRLNMQVQIGLSNDERCGACYDYFKERFTFPDRSDSIFVQGKMPDCIAKASHTDEPDISGFDRSINSQTGVEYSQWTESRTPSSQAPSCHNGKLNLLDSTKESITKQLSSRAIKKYQNRCLNAGGRSFDSLRCQRLIEYPDGIHKSLISDLKTENGPHKVSIPTDCGREVSLKSSKECTTGGYCTWNLCNQHICRSCREQGEVMDFEYHIANPEEAKGMGKGSGEEESAGA